MGGAPEAVRPMEGDDAYNRSSRVQGSGLLPAVALLEEAARVIPLAPAPEAIVFADYGASEGKTRSFRSRPRCGL
jgi:salicylate 1-O-methyltransferase